MKTKGSSLLQRHQTSLTRKSFYCKGGSPALRKRWASALSPKPKHLS